MPSRRPPILASAPALDRIPMTRWLLRGGVAGPLVFVVGFVLIGAVRAGYDPIRQFVSLLSLTADGWLQTVNFLVTGALIVGGAIGLRRVLTSGPGSTWVPILIGIAGIGIVLAGVFTTDPSQGYPLGAPAGVPTAYSTSGAIHQAVSTVVFFGLPIAAFVLARRFRNDGGYWATYCRGSGVGIVAFLIAAFSVPDVAGLLQRIAIMLAYGWIARVMWRFAHEADGVVSPARGTGDAHRPR